MLVNPTEIPTVAFIHWSIIVHATATIPRSKPPKNLLPFCSVVRYRTVASPGRTSGILAPILTMYSLTSFGVSCRSR